MRVTSMLLIALVVLKPSMWVTLSWSICAKNVFQLVLFISFSLGSSNHSPTRNSSGQTLILSTSLLDGKFLPSLMLLICSSIFLLMLQHLFLLSSRSRALPR
ncbi:hypothetical protein PanWU01x14_145200 [Parasponia andersonii]|uniref:Transmembrane protein n=1 Tax=Parasponia andersonii TaxID=3476 RepID=A0A2P5CKP6_PARAD|nr:hypothetical protein PanWU01x14_145200 [Parasponia andersonii]